MRRTKLNHKHREISRLWNQGASVESIAKRIGCSLSAVYVFAKRHGLKPRRRTKSRKSAGAALNFDPTKIKRVIKLRIEGLNALGISAKTGLSPDAVGRILKRHNMHLLTRKQRRDILHRIYGFRERAGIGEDELKRLIGYKRASTELFVKGEGLMKYLNRIAKVLKVPYKKLWAPIRCQ